MSQFGLIAELGIALAGFTGIFLALTGTTARQSEFDAIGIRLIIIDSLLPAFLALIPIVLESTSLELTTIWRVSSFSYAIAATYAFIHIEKKLLSIPAEAKPQHLSAQNFIGRYSTIALILAQIPNIVGWPYPPDPTVFLTGLVVALGLGAMTFAGFLLARL